MALSCSSSGDDAPDDRSGGPGDGGTGATTESLSALGLTGGEVVVLDDTVDQIFTDVFTRYTAIETLTGRVHVLAQDSVPAEKIVRAREILRLAMTDLGAAGRAGSAKSDVAEEMVNAGAILALFADDASIDTALPEVAAFFGDFEGSSAPLAATNIILEGTADYMAALPSADHTFGAAASLVLRTGIDAARTDVAAGLDTLTANAIAAGTFTPPTPLLPELESAAYLGLAMDVHAGVFGHDPDGDGISRAHGAEATFIDRESLALADPALAAWIDDFFTPDHSFHVLLPGSFTGNFDGLRRSMTPYTARSQHLRLVELQGSNTAEIFGAPFDTTLIGNAGNNNLKGRAGNDTLVGGDGFDTAVFTGIQANYEITYEGDTIIVEDVLGGHDAVDTLTGIERLQFSDGGVNL